MSAEDWWRWQRKQRKRQWIKDRAKELQRNIPVMKSFRSILHDVRLTYNLYSRLNR